MALQRIPELREPHQRGRLVVALALALILAVLGANLAQAQTRVSVSISYELEVSPQSLRLCTGESHEIVLKIVRLRDRGAQSLPARFLAWGGRVLGDVRDDDVGQFSPAEAGRDVRGPAQPRAVYTLVAKAPGRTTIDFHIVDTGDEDALGDRLPGDSVSIPVEVTDCFEAYTSGLGMFFTVKDMGDLIQPFTLEAFSPPTNGITTSSQAMFFMPSGPRNQFLPSFSGLYVSVISDTTQLGGVEVTCLDVLSGSYEVDFHITPDDPRFRSGIDVGNLLLFGKGSKYCQGRLVLSVNYVSDPGYQISFKPTVPPPP